MEIPSLPLNIRENKMEAKDLLFHEKSTVFLLAQNPDGSLKIDYPKEGGIYVHKFGAQMVEGGYSASSRVDCLYPSKGFPDAESLQACNMVKRNLIGQLRVISQRVFWPSWILFILLPWRYQRKVINAFINEFNSFGEIALRGYRLEDMRYTVFCREFRKLLEGMLQNLGLTHEMKNFITLLEFDNAYQSRLQDLLSETTKEQLQKNPRKEIRRLFNIFKQRDMERKGGSLRGKTKLIYRMIQIVFMVPRIRNSFVKSLDTIEFSKLQFDAGDRYWKLHCEPGEPDRYQFMGLPASKRRELWLQIHHNNPPKAIYIGI